MYVMHEVQKLEDHLQVKKLSHSYLQPSIKLNEYVVLQYLSPIESVSQNFIIYINYSKFLHHYFSLLL